MSGHGSSSAPGSDAGEAQQPRMIAGGGGTRIAVYEYGDPRGPAILFVHGFSQSHLAWSRQYKAPELQTFRMVAIDLRGHGASDKPMSPESYASGETWADDVHAVLSALRLQKPLVVVWSYGGFVVCDYVRKYGDGELAGSCSSPRSRRWARRIRRDTTVPG